ncbi:MAG: DUF2971 domain-containing protein [Planctomycetes bacterium]|nr:DUF2971 domain-containing protein [Planctomycetota bacterium]
MHDNHVKLPQILYKYRGIGSFERDLKCMLVRRQLWLSAVNELNDPYDCLPVVDSSRPDDPKGPIRALLARLFPEDKKEQRLKRLFADLTQVVDDGAQRELHEQISTGFGVLSFSANPRHPVMWAHYASNFRGFVVGYRGQIKGHLPVVAASRVTYQSQRPIMPAVGPRVESWPAVLHTKAPEWAYEEEWRFVRTPIDGGPGLLNLPSGSIAEVLLGPRMSSDHREKVIKAAHLVEDRPTVREVVLMPKQFGMRFVDL